MFNPCKSYTLNIVAVAGIWDFYSFAFVVYDILKGKEYPGTGDILGFILIPLGLIFGCITLLGLVLESICKLFKLKFAFNFPVHKFKSFVIRLIYYTLFYLGLLTIIFHILFIWYVLVLSEFFYYF